MALSQPIVITGGAVDIYKTAKAAKEKVDRDEDGIPIHACGAVTRRECPCPICDERNCAACFATIY